jgi:hypothetical protein
MFKTRVAIFLMMALSLLLLATVAAQDAGQFVILNAQYGNERNHVDVTKRLKDLARRDRPFRISDGSMAADPDRGHAITRGASVSAARATCSFPNPAPWDC